MRPPAPRTHGLRPPELGSEGPRALAHGRPPRRRGYVYLGLALAGCASPASVSYRETAQYSETGDTKTNSHSRLLEVGVEQGLGPDLALRGSERILHSDLEQRGAGTRTTDQRLLHQPSVDVLYESGSVTWNQGVDYTESQSDPSEGESNELVRTDVLEKVEWQPHNLPMVTAWVRGRTEEDDLFIDQESLETVLEIEDTDNAVSYLYSLEDERIRDHETGVDRDRFEQLLRLGYRDQTSDGRVSGSLNLYRNERDTTTDLPRADGAAVPGGQVFPLRGYAQIDTTPGVGTLPELPTLIDSDLSTPVGVNIGGFASGGETFWNIGLELPPNEAIDLVMLSTSEEVEPIFVTQFTFSVWTSDDGTIWNLVSGAAPYVYEAAFRRFRIPIPSVEARFVKIVNSNSPPAVGAVEVSELRVFEAQNTSDGVTRTESSDTTTNLTGTLAWRITETVIFGYDLFAQKADRDDDGEEVRSEERLDNGLRLNWIASDTVDVNLNAREQRLQDVVRQDERFRVLNGVLDYRPLDTLDVALNFSKTDRQVDGADSLETSAYAARSSARLLETLEVDLTLEQNQQIDAVNARTIDRSIVATSANADWTPAWSSTMGVRIEEATVTGAGADEIPDPSEEVYELLLLYRPSDLLTIEADLEWKDTFVGSGLDQRLRLDWLPFPEGVLDLQLDVQRRVTGALDRRVDQYQALARWTFSPMLFFETGYSVQRPDEGDSTSILTFALSARF